MNTNTSNSYSRVKFCVEELRKENTRLNSELLYANKCVNILMKFKSFIDKNHIEISNSLRHQKLFNLNTNFVNECKSFEFEWSGVMREKNSKNIALNKNCGVKLEICDEFNKDLTDYDDYISDTTSIISDNNSNITVNTIQKRNINSKKTIFANKAIRSNDNNGNNQRSVQSKTVNNLTDNITVNSSDKSNDNSNKTVNTTQTRNINSKKKVFANKAIGSNNNFDDKQFARNSKGRIVPRQRANYRKGENQQIMDKAVEYYNQHKGVESLVSVAKLFGVKKSGLFNRVGKQPKIVKRYACDQTDCGIKFADLTDFVSHMSVAHDINIYECDFDGCEYTAKTKQRLTNHKRIHSEIKPHACEWPGCDYQSITPSRVNRHRNTHLGINYTCEWPECNATFKLKSKYKAHMNKHNGYKPFRCSWPECKRSFTNDKYLNDHLMIHKGEYKYDCDWPGCDKRFVLKDSMQRHMKLLHQKPS